MKNEDLDFPSSLKSFILNYLFTLCPSIPILTTLAGKDCVLLYLVQEFIEIEDWLLLTLFIYSYNQSSCIHPIVQILFQSKANIINPPHA